MARGCRTRESRAERAPVLELRWVQYPIAVEKETMLRDAVLIITSQDEISIPPVLGYLKEMQQPYFRLDADAILNNRAVLSMNLHNSDFTGSIRLPNGDAISMTRIKSVWFRRPKTVLVKGLYANSEESAFAESEMSAALWSLYSNLDRIFWMNHPISSRHILEHNKLLQMKLAAMCGLRVPDTVVSNNSAELISFCEQHGGVIAVKILRKAVLNNVGRSGIGIYTNVVTLDYLKKHAANISSTALMAQEYVAKKVELRVTIVGTKLLACVIHSQDSERTRIDWRRYDFERVKHEVYELPTSVAAKLLAFMKRCNLSFGAVDMIITPDDNFVFLEINPSGQFGWIERLTSLPISRTIAELLTDPPNRGLDWPDHNSSK